MMPERVAITAMPLAFDTLASDGPSKMVPASSWLSKRGDLTVFLVSVFVMLKSLYRGSISPQGSSGRPGEPRGLLISTQQTTNRADALSQLCPHHANFVSLSRLRKSPRVYDGDQQEATCSFIGPGQTNMHTLGSSRPLLAARRVTVQPWRKLDHAVTLGGVIAAAALCLQGSRRSLWSRYGTVDAFGKEANFTLLLWISCLMLHLSQPFGNEGILAGWGVSAYWSVTPRRILPYSRADVEIAVPRMESDG